MRTAQRDGSQSCCYGDARPGDFDGMAELWFDDLVALLEARHSSAWAASTVDEVNFLDPARSAYFVCEER